MIDLESNLGLLLHRHNEVYVPDFGIFIKKKYPTRLKSEKNQTSIIPFKEEIIFEESNQNNSFLINHFVFDLKIPLSTVENEISLIVASWKDMLNKGESLEIKNVGTIVKTENGAISFIQDQNFLLNDLEEISINHIKPNATLTYFSTFFYFILLVGLTISVAILLYLMWYFYFPV